MAQPTLVDIAVRNGSDAVAGLVDECTKAHPELTLGAARTIKGQNYKTRVRTTLPTVAFRAANEGVTPSKSVVVNKLVETYIFNPMWICDKAVADRDEDGPDAYIGEEGQAVVEASMQFICSQFYYGVGAGGDAKGFPGLLAALDSGMTVDAGGTTATTGSSVWAVRWGRKDVIWVWGENGQLELAPVRIQTVLDAATKPYTAYVEEILAYPGLQVGAKFSVGRIKKLTADSGKGATDALISQLLSKFPAGMPPDLLLMSRRSLQQLQSSRTATSPTGAPAPIPDQSLNVPIKVTDAILDTEALTL